jgi:hypothetical protein
MKSQEFRSVLNALAGFLDSVGAREASQRIAMFAVVFDLAPTSQVSALLKRFSPISSESSGSPSLGDVEKLISGFYELAKKVGKAGIAKDLDAVRAFLHARRSSELDSFIHLAAAAVASPAKRPGKGSLDVRADLVTKYQKALEVTLGDEEQFSAVFGEISTNADLGKQEMIALAKQVTGASLRSRPATLKKLWSFNQSLLTFKSKSQATKGRSAA